MQPIIHTFTHRSSCGLATLETSIDYQCIDDEIKILCVQNTLNDSYPIPVSDSSFIQYRIRFGKSLKHHAARELERMKIEARRHDEWLREELSITGAMA
jgi:hypothetical protein